MANNLTILTKVSDSVSIFDIVAPAGLVNGNMIEIDAQNTDKTYDVKVPTAITSLELMLVATVTLPYEVEKTENDYEIATGEIIRVYQPYEGMVVSFPVSNFTATQAAAQGVFVIADAATYTMEMVSALGGTESVAFIIDETFTKAGVSMLKMRCIKSI